MKLSRVIIGAAIGSFVLPLVYGKPISKRLFYRAYANTCHLQKEASRIFHRYVSLRLWLLKLPEIILKRDKDLQVNYQ